MIEGNKGAGSNPLDKTEAMEIVRMIELGLGNKKAALDARTACSVKVVAGAGFEPATFRL